MCALPCSCACAYIWTVLKETLLLFVVLIVDELTGIDFMSMKKRFHSKIAAFYFCHPGGREYLLFHFRYVEV